MNPPTDVGKKELAAHGVVLSIHRTDLRRYDLVDPYDLEVIIVQRYLVDNWVGAGEALLDVCVGFLTHRRAEKRKLSVLFKNRHKVMNLEDLI